MLNSNIPRIYIVSKALEAIGNQKRNNSIIHSIIMIAYYNQGYVRHSENSN